MLFVYRFILLLASPFFLYSLYKKKTGKPNIGKRWKEHFGCTPTLKNHQVRPIWIHAVSVGEVIAVTPLLKAIKEQLPEQPIVLTTTTSTGAEQASKLDKLAEHRYMPLDFNFAVKGFIRAVKPRQLIIMETELWPNTLHQAKKSDINTTVINARLSDRSAKRYAKFPAIFKLLSKNIDTVLCQYSDDALRFSELGLNEKKIAITGSIKFDISITDNVIHEGELLRQKLGHHRSIWIAASTHQGEDQQIISSHITLLKTFPDALLIIVPRHPERFNDVFQLCIDSQLITHRRTQKTANTPAPQVYLADTMGEMLLLLAASDICFMGGSLIGNKVGGHNLLEPAALCLPSLIGPSFYNFTDITKQLCTEGATTIIKSKEELAEQLKHLFNNPTLLKKRGELALSVVHKNQGAINKTLQGLNL